MNTLNTVDTTRLPFDAATEMAIAVSQMLWPRLPALSAPKVVILVPDRAFPYAYVAASLVHDPIMGIILFSPVDSLAPGTRAEIERLNPQGTEDLPPIIAIGPYDSDVVQTLERMGYPVLSMTGQNIFTLAANVARMRSDITPASPDGPVSLFVVPSENPFDGLPATYYATHAGVPILFTEARRLPPSTAKVLKEMGNKTVYIFGSNQTISDSVVREISNLMKKPVRRISGRDPFELSVNFAQYYDNSTQLGWNRRRRGQGDAFTFANLEHWELAVAASGFAHQGKHTPLLLVAKDDDLETVTDYLKLLRPALAMPPRPPFMHGFILGSPNIIAFETQADLEMSMKIDEQPQT